MELTANNVHDLMVYCLYTKEEVPPDFDGTKETLPKGCVYVEGVMSAYAFHPARLEEKRADIKSMIEQLDPAFYDINGEGDLFLNLCVRKDGEQWGEHPDCEALTVLSIGLGFAVIPVPRMLWLAMPGGLPSVKFMLEGKKGLH